MAAKLFRGNSRLITNFLSSMGGIKETRLSGILGYLFKLEPSIAEDLFSLKSSIKNIFLESHQNESNDRQDIVIVTSDGRRHCIEAKIESHQISQIHRYRKNFDRLYLIESTSLVSTAIRKTCDQVVSWQELAAALRKFTKRRGCHPEAKLVIQNLLLHLEENEMIDRELKDVYVRDLSGDSVETYFSYNFYQCQPQYFKAVSKCRYFAPYLTKSNQSGERESIFKILGNGISYFSKIESVRLIEYRDLPQVLKDHGYTSSEVLRIFETIGRKPSSRAEVTAVLLGKPMRLTQKPITKHDLYGKNTGAMIGSFDIGDLIGAANGIKLKSRAA